MGLCKAALHACSVSHFRHKDFLWRRSSQSNWQQHRRVAVAWRTYPCRAVQDPLQDAMYETWGSELDDWDSREYADDELIDALYTDEGSAGSTAQNVLAIALALLLVLAVGNVIFKIVIVSWALFSAAVRYSAVALILICLGTLLA